MKKDIITIGYQIPGFSDLLEHFSSKSSLMDADIVVLSPEDLSPSYNGWVSFTRGGGGCYDTSSTNSYIKRIKQLKKEIKDSLDLGKSIFIILAEEEIYSLATSLTSKRKGETTYNTSSQSNYEFLPNKVGNIISAKGKHIKFTGHSVFTEFYRTFKDNLEFNLYLENQDGAKTIFTAKDKTKILGSVQKISNGHIITLPYIAYDNDQFTKYDDKEDKTLWTEEALEFGEKLVNSIISIDSELNLNSEKTQPPKWIDNEKYTTKNAKKLRESISVNELKIQDLKEKKLLLNSKLLKEEAFQDLLFEKGKPLENAVTNALIILGYKAENYDDGVLELDQVILSPEKHRFVGECEGKDNKDININKFRQLLESLSADFEREEVEEKAFGILFGNPQRLLEPSERTLSFTKKCMIGAEREKIALVRTEDLFSVIKYLKTNKNAKFKRNCRNAIFNGLGKIVEFPKIPTNKE